MNCPGGIYTNHPDFFDKFKTKPDFKSSSIAESQNYYLEEEEMAFGVVIIIIAVGIGVTVGLSQRKKANALIEDGRMVKRDISFVETAEVFTLSNADFSRVVDAIKVSDLSGTGVSADRNSEKQAILFKSGGWAAQLYRMEDDGNKYVYCFVFTSWQTYRGIPQNHVQMNLLITAVEKAFINIDQDTQVQSSKIRTKSKASFF